MLYFFLILFLLKTLLRDEPLKQPLEFRLQNSQCFFSKLVLHSWRVPHARSTWAWHARPQSHSPFSSSLQTFCLSACMHLNMQKYGAFCSLPWFCLVVFNSQALKEKADAALFLFSFTDRYVCSLIIQSTTDNLDLLGKLKCLSYWG